MKSLKVWISLISTDASKNTPEILEKNNNPDNLPFSWHGIFCSARDTVN